MLVVWLVWTATGGGYFPRDWHPAGLVLVALLAVTALGLGRVLPSSRAASVALLSLLGLVVWTIASIAWADWPGAAWEAGAKLVVIVAGTWILALLPWRERAALSFAAAWAVGTAVIGAIEVADAAGAAAADLSDRFVEGRWLPPLGYPNAVAAMAAMTAWPALALSYRRGLPWPVQGLFLALAAFLVEFALLPQSRAGFFGLAVALPAFVALAPDRLRLLPRLLILAGAVVVALDPLYDVYTAGSTLDLGLPGPPLEPTMDRAARAMAITTPAAGALGALVSAVEPRLHPSPSLERGLRLAVVGGLALAATVALVLGLANAGRISTAVADRFESVTTVPDSRDGSGSDRGPRIASDFSGQRADYYRVALDAFSDAPVAGLGGGNYERFYTRERRLEKPSRFAHSIWLRFLADGGVVAVLLLAIAVAALAVGLGGAWRRLAAEGRGLVAAAAAGLAYFLVHGSLDWLDEFPLLVTAALGLPLIANACAGPYGRARMSVAGAVVVGVAAAGIGLALMLSWLSLRYVERGSERGRPAGQAFRDLDRAARLNPLSARPLIREGTIAAAVGDTARARRAFADALDREESWYPHFELALLDGQVRRYGVAERHIRRAEILNPEDPFVERVGADVRSRRRIDPAAIHREIVRFERTRFTTGER